MLVEARVGRLATADAAGHPLVVPVCFAYDGATVYSAIDTKPKRVSDRRLRRIRNIEANPHVSLVVDEYDEDWRRLRYVIVEGRARILVPGADPFATAVRLLVEKYPQYRAMGLERVAATVIAITPDRMLPWSFAS